MGIGYKSNEAKHFVVTAVFEGSDGRSIRQDHHVVPPNETVKEIFDRIIPEIDSAIFWGKYPVRIEISPDVRAVPADDRVERMGSWLQNPESVPF